MNALLQGKQAFITGASSGIGRAIAELFAEHQATLYLNGRNREVLDSLAEKLRQRYGVSVFVHAFDVGDAQAVKEGFRNVFAQTKSLDILINNAGVRIDSLLAMASKNALSESFATNSFGPFYCCQYAARMMRRAGGGSIVNMSSGMALNGYAGQSVYAASKAALIGMSRSLAKELAGDQIRVNAIAPGFIETPLVADLTDSQRLEHIQQISLKRAGSAQEVAQCALFLASAMASYITGEVIKVDGGTQL
ncbi:SDR family NAD(P)-dependent oxidoreductase [Celerinatantimonas diazotrophica]|uniref:3-oxoacyl-[acyl-carrier protein] reductase n=1 Tax=Celerinatantimonas diazotrophica TaxID=412034 RepID=A0A4R1KAN0_9GAMM|nr:SDR family NAD(P)-dependent oxidoreductase [Celerinatantimonas diazotrophica]TCK61097.1 3-oxoacyl-[acyl-carrier protein] reductase [Celerinatantimonas diazotrophica]CAG9295146.1 3-oxoacyl-[acyl-carrier-protein] reductase FabG [Celerinatantimonas diazotrophica]